MFVLFIVASWGFFQLSGPGTWMIFWGVWRASWI